MGAQIDVNQKSEIFGISVGLATRFFRDDALGEQGVWHGAGAEEIVASCGFLQ
jgi:hypothetical protein